MLHPPVWLVKQGQFHFFMSSGIAGEESKLSLFLLFLPAFF